MWPCIVVLTAGAWLITASITFVWLAGLSGLLARPWMAWWLYATHSPDTYTKALLAGSALLLPFIVAVAAALWFRVQRTYIQPRRAYQALYGDAKFATKAQMQANKITGIRSFHDA